jgi:putative peptidoglycan lipid II flippase
VGNEGRQSSLPEQGSDQQAGYGWQYDQDDDATAASVGTPSSLDPLHTHSPQPLPPSAQTPIAPDHSSNTLNPASPQIQQGRQISLPATYEKPLYDMGTSLGYGQGMEYQFSDAPQPFHPMEHLRQERLQQLREERMRRQQRRIRSDLSTLFSGKKKAAEPVNSIATPSVPVPPPSGPFARPSEALASPNGVDAIAQLSPVSRHSDKQAQLYDLEQMQPASQSVQDTGRIQKLRVGRAALILTSAFVASRFLGLLRTSMFAFVFGTSITSDAYLQAFLIPDLIFNIVAGGALASAFIPVFTRYMIAEKDEKTAWHIASSALNLALAIMVVLAVIAIICAPWLVPIYNPGIHDPTELALIASLTRIMLLQAVALGVGVIVNAVLNARQDFLRPAVGTVMYNVGLIIGLLPGIYFAFLGQRNDTVAVYAATWGVVLGALLQVGVQVPGLFKVGLRYTPAFDWRHPGVIQIARQMVPRIINASMLYLSTFVDRGLIQLMVGVIVIKDTDGLITQYYQAMQLMLLPLGIFGMAVSTAAFPTLAENVARGRMDRVRDSILETVRSILFMSIPSAIGLIVLGLPIIQVLLQHGRYSLSMAQSTAVPLAFFALGLPALAAVEILTRSFYAMRDSTTPVVISVGQFVFKIALSLLLINVAIWGSQWGMGALAFSTSLAGTLEAGILFYLLNQRIGELQIRVVVLFIGRVLISALAMGFVLLITRYVLDSLLAVLGHIPFLDTTDTPTLKIAGTLIALLKLLLELFIGVLIYVRAARILGIEELGPVRRVLDRLKLSWI